MKLTWSLIARPRADKKRADGKLPMYWFLRVGPYTKKIPMGKYIEPHDWDIKNDCLKKTSEFQKLLSLNIIQKIAGFQSYMLEQENAGKTITSLLAMAYFEEKKQVNLFTFWEEQVIYWRDTENYAPATIKSYNSVLKILKEFNSNLNFNDIDLTMLKKFDTYLTFKERPNTTNGKFVKHKILKSILNQGVLQGHLKSNPYITNKFKIRSESVKRNFLCLEEIRQLMNFQPSKQPPHLNLVKNLFLFSSFTGLRYSDVMALKVENVVLNAGHPRLELKITKTQKPLSLPLLPEAQKIIESYVAIYQDNTAKNVFPYITNQQINRALKDLIPLAGINKVLTFHSSRHGFASNLIELNTSLIHVKDLLGHSSIVQTQIYAKPIDSEIHKSMSNLSLSYK